MLATVSALPALVSWPWALLGLPLAMAGALLALVSRP